jgi:hypothetical protein
MTETLVGLTLMKEASKYYETLQEYRSGDGKNNPGVESPRSLSISIHLNFPLNGVPH